MTDVDLEMGEAQYEALKARLTMMVRLAEMEFKAPPIAILTAVSDVFVTMSQELIGQERLASTAVPPLVRRKPSRHLKRR